MSPALDTTSNSDRTPTPGVLRVGSVSYLNAKPLIYGLEHDRDVSLSLAVPSKLLEGLQSGDFDVALLPVIDYQRMEGLTLLRSGGIGSDGATLTVRVFSRVPVNRIRSLACDTDSHTSVALARVVLGERHGVRPAFVDWRVGDETTADARLLIGDKVVCEEPVGFDHQLDLGEEWKRLTGLPFVFAAWMARGGVDLRDLPEKLARAKRDGLRNVREIVERHARPRGWPAELATQYLTAYLKFDVGEREVRAIELFHRMAGQYAVVGEPVRELVQYSEPRERF